MPERSNGVDSRSTGFRLRGSESSSPHKMNSKSRKLSAIICESCGERYSLRNFSKENPLEVCGECGCEFFLPYSRDCMKGYKSLEQYLGVMDLLPLRLRSVFPLELSPQLSPFIESR